MRLASRLDAEAFVFGSYARGAPAPKDIDILLVVPDTLPATSIPHKHIGGYTQRATSGMDIHWCTRTEFAQNASPVIMTARRDAIRIEKLPEE